MNPRHPDHADARHVDLREERLARELRAAATQIDLVPGSELAVVTRGRRRHQRRRRATTFTLVTALTGGTVWGVQQLARTGDQSIASEQADATLAPDATGPADPATTTAPPAPPAPPAEGTAPVAVPANAGSGAADIPDDIPAAQLVEPTIEWTVVEPDSAAAVAYANWGAVDVQIPGIMLSTAPGRSDDYEPMLWRTDDGISWEPAGIDLPVGRPDQLTVDGSMLYAVGTAPGVAAGEPNPLRFASSADGVTWDSVELPLDIVGSDELPYLSGIGAYGTAVPYDGGVFVLVQRSVAPDWEALGEIDERLASGFYSYDATGVSVLIGDGCGATVPTTAVVGTVPGGGELVALADFAPATVPPGPPCDIEMLTWRELGLPDATVAELEAPWVRGFRVEGDVVTEVAVPEGLYVVGYPGDDGLFTDVSGAYFRLDDDGALVPTEGPDSVIGQFGWPIGERDGVTFASVHTGDSFGTGRDLVVTEGPDGVQWTDFSAIHGETLLPAPVVAAVTPAGLVRATVSYPDPVAAAGGMERSDGGLTVRRSSMRQQPVFSLTGSGETLALDDLRQDSMTGDVVVVDGDGTEIARMSNAVASEVLYGSSADVQQGSWFIETTVDGRNVAVESVADLLGVDDADVSSVPRISTDGTRTIVAVTMTERNEDGVPRQLVLVGTPKA